MAMTPDARPTTALGTRRVVVELLPTWPWLLLPQHLTPPAVVSAQVWLKPAAMALTPDERPTTATGTRLKLVELLPSSALPLVPQHLTPPAEVSAQVWESSEAMAVTPDE